jgi:hypothetical protein
MFSLSLHEDAEDDLDEIWETDPDSAAFIDALLEQIKADQNLLDALTDRNFGEYGNEPFSVKTWVEQWRDGYDLWRLKAWELEEQHIRYRVIYAYETGKQRYHVLAVVPRSSFNYERDHPITQRIHAAYDRLCLTQH